ncbi:MAG: DUF262 domain-containing protein [Deltaproteobacteria bacterium]|nr:DUF262 domain-containing protein [Deltaproteobacteria bacterium]
MSSRVKKLRKPDFQRATWAWTPEDCVLLLESVIKGLVIPSIIMWYSSENGYDYVLDGGHRISVIMAWLKNDWGDRLAPDQFEDEAQVAKIRKAASQVRALIETKIGNLDDYKAAADKFEQIVQAGEEVPKKVLDERTFERAQFYVRLSKGSVGFHVLWVNGDYKTAEQSFLKINWSGKQLTEWERTLIKNRDSSFARAVMSIANIDSVEHYWPVIIPENEGSSELKQDVEEIIQGVSSIHNLLFKPAYQTKAVTRLRQPLMHIPERYKRPYQIAELLTIIEGGKGQTAETEKLLSKDRDSSSEDIIASGKKLIDEALDSLNHLLGSSQTQKSLSLVPALYFYTDIGRYVRSLLYGFIYWLLSGNYSSILNRKRIFSAHRATFEQIIFNRQEDVVTGFGRKTGSGPEVTAQTAQYYQCVFELLVKHHSQIETDAFIEEYAEIISKLTNRRITKPKTSDRKSRFFTSKQKSVKRLRTFIESAPKCGICGGIYDPASGLQDDHILERWKGGKTIDDNQRLVHPFCNNDANRKIIESLKNGQESLKLPVFEAETEMRKQQLTFFDEFEFI